MMKFLGLAACMQHFLGQTEQFEASRGQFLGFYESKMENEPKEGPQEGPKTAQEPPRGPKL